MGKSGGVWFCVHALVLVFAKWDKYRKLDLPLSPNRAKGQIPKICKSLNYQGTSEDTGPSRLESLAVPPCLHNTTALLREMEWGWAVGRQDIALTDELAERQGHHNQKMQCFESKRPKSLWAKMHTQRQQTLHLDLMGSLPYIQRSNCIPEIHTLRNAWKNIAVLPNHESELPNVTKWAKMESAATHGECNLAHKIQHGEEI